MPKQHSTTQQRKRVFQAFQDQTVFSYEGEHLKLKSGADRAL